MRKVEREGVRKVDERGRKRDVWDRKRDNEVKRGVRDERGRKRDV